jgi:hypothetical protein
VLGRPVFANLIECLVVLPVKTEPQARGLDVLGGRLGLAHHGHGPESAVDYLGGLGELTGYDRDQLGNRGIRVVAQRSQPGFGLDVRMGSVKLPPAVLGRDAPKLALLAGARHDQS